MQMAIIDGAARHGLAPLIANWIILGIVVRALRAKPGVQAAPHAQSRGI